MSELDPVGTIIDRGLRQLASLGGDLPAEANRIGTILWSPPRVVIVGRLKAGKSTLVNALIGAPVAETAALEATNVVTVYQDGAPSRAELVSRSGVRAPLQLDHQRPIAIGIPTVDTAYIHRFLPSQAIRDLTLIDTPGLATLTAANAEATSRALIDSFEQTREASVDADAAVFLFDAAPRADEFDFLRKIGFTPLNTLGVLSRADSFGEGILGRRDPLDHAAEHAQTLAQQLRDTVSTVIPVAGLLAETSHTGRLTEHDAKMLAALGSYEELELFDLLHAGGNSTHDRLLDLLGEYGVIGGRRAAVQGAHHLNKWLTERSGVLALRRHLHAAIREFALLQRANRILDQIDQLAFRHPARDQIRGISHGIRTDPVVTPVRLFQSLRGLLDADPTSPVVPELQQLLRGRTHSERLGLPGDATQHQVTDAARGRLAWAHQRALATMSAAEDAALVDLTHAYSVMIGPR